MRDLCLGLKPRDYDVLTTASPQQVRGLSRDGGGGGTEARDWKAAVGHVRALQCALPPSWSFLPQQGRSSLVESRHSASPSFVACRLLVSEPCPPAMSCADVCCAVQCCTVPCCLRACLPSGEGVFWRPCHGDPQPHLDALPRALGRPMCGGEPAIWQTCSSRAALMVPVAPPCTPHLAPCLEGSALMP